MRKWLWAVLLAAAVCGSGWAALPAAGGEGRMFACRLPVAGESRTAVEQEAASEISIDLSQLDLEDNVLVVEPGDAIDRQITGTPSGLVFGAADMPSWLELRSDGLLQGVAAGNGVTYKPTVTATLPTGQSKSVSFFVYVQATGTPNPNTGNSGGSGGGCNGGIGVLALMLAAALPLRRKAA